MPEKPIALLPPNDLVRRFRTWGQAHRFLDRPCPKRVLDVLLQCQALQVVLEIRACVGLVASCRPLSGKQIDPRTLLPTGTVLTERNVPAFLLGPGAQGVA